MENFLTGFDRVMVPPPSAHIEESCPTRSSRTSPQGGSSSALLVACARHAFRGHTIRASRLGTLTEVLGFNSTNPSLAQGLACASATIGHDPYNYVNRSTLRNRRFENFLILLSSQSRSMHWYLRKCFWTLLMQAIRWQSLFHLNHSPLCRVLYSNRCTMAP
jgi:hypothetical protein